MDEYFTDDKIEELVKRYNYGVRKGNLPLALERRGTKKGATNHERT